MDNKIQIAIETMNNIDDAIKTKISKIFSSEDTKTWTSKLVTKSPFLIFKKPNKSNVWVFQDLYNSLSNDDYAIAIFKNKLNSDINDYKFALVDSLDMNGDSIAYMREKDDGALEGLFNVDSNDFLNSYDGYEYAFSFLLNDTEIFPSFTITDYEASPNIDRTFTLKDIFSYLYYCYENPLIETDEHKVNIFGIRSNYGYTDNNGEWMYKRRSTIQDYFIIAYLENKKWIIKFHPGTTLADEYYYKEDWGDSIGLGIVIDGQHENAYELGKHGTYSALRQAGVLQHYRDKTNKADSEYYEFTLQSQVYNNENNDGSDFPYFNLHTNCPRSRSSGKITASKSTGSGISQYSQGCQVIALPSGNDWNDDLMKAFNKQKEKTGKSTFNYTIIEEWDFLQFMQIVNGED